MASGPNRAPIAPDNGRIAQVQISTANAVRDGSGTMGDVVTGATNGTRVAYVTVTATGTTTAGMIRFHVYPGSGTARLVYELPVTAITPSASVQAFTGTWTPTADFILQSTYKIQASTNNAETFNIHAVCQDY
jgi:hypothetical protein